MKKLKAIILSATLFAAAGTISSCQNDSKECDDFFRYKALPELMLDFANTRYQAYFHYNMCTFKNLEDTEKHHGRSNGKEPISMYNPTGLDCAQWAQVCKDARMEGGWFTTKHHGGFCMWDSKFTTYDVGSAKDKRDVVGEFVREFRKAGLKVGLYYSILDYHHNMDNGTVSQTEIEFTKNQIRELLTNYGPIDYMNFDGWNTWPTLPDFDDVNYREILELVKELQPNCLIISHTYESNLAHAEVPFADAANRLYNYHPEYMRPVAASDFLQCDWWWDNPNALKSADYVLEHLKSYNDHNAVYILNISPNPAGRIDDNAWAVLKEAASRWERPADIEKPGDNWGYSYDVNKNKAFLRYATQSSTEEPIRDMRARPRAEIALDGVTEAKTGMEQTSLTLVEDNPWWRVNLAEFSKVKSIEIHFSEDVQSIQDFTVELWDKGANTVWSSQHKNFTDKVLTLKVPAVESQYVHIQGNGNGQMAIGEVIVM